MFSWLEPEVTRLGKTASKGKGVAYGAAWLLGCAKGIESQFADLREKARQAEQTQAMVLLNSRGEESKHFLRTTIGTKLASNAGCGVRNRNAVNDGFDTGKSMHIRQGIQGASKPNALT
jgi:hypothetical protein